LLHWPSASLKEQENFDLAQELEKNPANMFEIPEMMVGYLFGPKYFKHILFPNHSKKSQPIKVYQD
jgi:hypothetical protein